MSQFQILGRRPFPFKAISIRFAYTNISDTIVLVCPANHQVRHAMLLAYDLVITAMVIQVRS